MSVVDTWRKWPGDNPKHVCRVMPEITNETSGPIHRLLYLHDLPDSMSPFGSRASIELISGATSPASPRDVFNAQIAALPLQHMPRVVEVDGGDYISIRIDGITKFSRPIEWWNSKSYTINKEIDDLISIITSSLTSADPMIGTWWRMHSINFRITRYMSIGPLVHHHGYEIVFIDDQVGWISLSKLSICEKAIPRRVVEEKLDGQSPKQKARADIADQPHTGGWCVWFDSTWLFGQNSWDGEPNKIDLMLAALITAFESPMRSNVETEPSVGQTPVNNEPVLVCDPAINHSDSPGLHVRCDRCGDILDSPGALVFGVPRTGGIVTKRHICVHCESALESVFEIPKPDSNHRYDELNRELDRVIARNKELEDRLRDIRLRSDGRSLP